MRGIISRLLREGIIEVAADSEAEGLTLFARDTRSNFIALIIIREIKLLASIRCTNKF